MRTKTILCLLFLMSGGCIYGQTASNDTINLRDGTQIIGKIHTIKETEVTFSYHNETVINTISKQRVKEIYLSSGRKEFYKEKEPEVIENSDPEVLLKRDNKINWADVEITYFASDVEGLVKKGDIQVTKKLNVILFQSASKLEKQVLDEAKQQAANMGAHIIYVVQPITSDGITFKVIGIACGNR